MPTTGGKRRRGGGSEALVERVCASNRRICDPPSLFRFFFSGGRRVINWSERIPRKSVVDECRNCTTCYGEFPMRLLGNKSSERGRECLISAVPRSNKGIFA